MAEINWYPGHMKKTKELIQENIKIVDIVLELIDARVPLSSKNPDIAKFAKNKKRILILNKADLVQKAELQKWKEYFIKNKLAHEVIELSAETGQNFKALNKIIDQIAKEKTKKMKAKGLIKANTRIMVAGVPNVGKSRLINRIVGKKSAGVGNKPGFTRGKQWIKVKEGLELLDTPGILWPKFENPQVGYNLAIAGAIRDEILPIEEVAGVLIKKMKRYGLIGALAKRYNLEMEIVDEIHSEKIIEAIALKNGMIIKGGKANIEQATLTLLRDYRSCRLGKFGIEQEFLSGEETL